MKNLIITFMPVTTFNPMISTLVVLGQILILVLIIMLIWNRLSKGKTKFAALNFVSKHSMLFAFVVALVAMLGSLYYSGVVGYNPCVLCWWQRVFIYPQVFILAIAFFLKDRNSLYYVLCLSGIAFLIATYHYLGQIGLTSLEACELLGYSTSCSERFVMNFGYITIPMMAMTAMAMNFVFALVGIFNRK